MVFKTTTTHSFHLLEPVPPWLGKVYSFSKNQVTVFPHCGLLINHHLPSNHLVFGETRLTFSPTQLPFLKKPCHISNGSGCQKISGAESADVVRRREECFSCNSLLSSFYLPPSPLPACLASSLLGGPSRPTQSVCHGAQLGRPLGSTQPRHF